MSGSCEITTPAAWVEAWRASPSSERATDISSLIRRSVSTNSFSRGSCSSAPSKRHVELVGDELRDLVDFGIRDFHHAADVANGRFGPERSERDDLADVIVAVLVDHVVDDLAAPIHAKIHIDIGQRNAFRIEEPLEQQAIDEWIKIGDA